MQCDLKCNDFFFINWNSRRWSSWCNRALDGTYVCFTYVCRCCIHRGLSIVEQHTECRKGKILKKKKKRLKSRLKRARKREKKLKKFGNAAYCYCAAAACLLICWWIFSLRFLFHFKCLFQVYFSSRYCWYLFVYIYILKLCKNYKKNVILRKRHCRCYKFYTRNSFFFSVYKNWEDEFAKRWNIFCFLCIV